MGRTSRSWRPVGDLLRSAKRSVERLWQYLQYIAGRKTRWGTGVERVFSSRERPFAEVEFAAVAIRCVRNNVRHIGVLHREMDSGDLLLLHLAWHHDLRNQAATDAYFWVDPSVHPRRLRQVAAICRQVWRSNQRELPYGLSPPNDCFDLETGRYLLGPTRHGLTCATFVLAVFDRAGLRLARYETWPSDRQDDVEWREWVLDQLAQGERPAPPEHLSAVREEPGAVRFRPEEVAGAATASVLPADFQIASVHAAEILHKIRHGDVR